MKLNNFEIRELSLKEQQELDAGGWIRDAVSYIVGYYSCGCHSQPSLWDGPVSYN